jgi:hypothetical protein
MSEPELRLRDLGRDAEHAVDLPDLGSLERRGRAMRFRRQASVVAAAVVLATAGAFLFQNRADRDLEPAPDPRAGVKVYPGGHVQELPAGTYELTASYDAADPSVLVTVPENWTSSKGPNRFLYQPGMNREESWAVSPWMVGMLALKLDGVASRWCETDLSAAAAVDGYDETVAAVQDLPGATLVGSARDERRFGYPATQVRVTVDGSDRCEEMSVVFVNADGAKIEVQSRTLLDVWVVDVDGTPLVIVAGSRGEVPEQFQQELRDVLGSVRFLPAD